MDRLNTPKKKLEIDILVRNQKYRNYLNHHLPGIVKFLSFFLSLSLSHSGVEQLLKKV